MNDTDHPHSSDDEHDLSHATDHFTHSDEDDDKLSPLPKPPSNPALKDTTDSLRSNTNLLTDVQVDVDEGSTAETPRSERGSGVGTPRGKLLSEERRRASTRRMSELRVDRGVIEHSVLLNASSRWDYVLVFKNVPVSEESGCCGCYTKMVQNMVSERGKVIRSLRRCGLIIKKQMSRDKDEVFVKVSIPKSKLYVMAERMNLRMVLKTSCGGGYAAFSASKEDIFEPQGDGGQLFSDAQRQRVCLHTIKENIAKGGAGIHIEKMLLEKTNLVQMYPLHNKEKVKWFKEQWVFKPFTKQPLEEVRKYFGEEVAMYFAFVGFYTLALIPLAIVGAITYIVQLSTTYDTPLIPIYCVFLAVWATVFIEMWKRKQSTLSYQWGLTESDDNIELRPEFRGEMRFGFNGSVGFVSLEDKVSEETRAAQVGEIDLGDKIIRVNRQPAFQSKKRYRVYLRVVPLIFLMIGLVIVMCTSGLLARMVIQRALKYSFFGGVIGGVILAVGIMILNFAYDFLATWLTFLENHRTQQDHYDSYVIKSFLFHFVNSYLSLFYIAFVKATGRINLYGEGLDQCHNAQGKTTGPEACLFELSSALLSLLATTAVVGQLQEILIPYLWRKGTVCYENMKLWCCASGEDRHAKMTEVALEGKLYAYTSTMEDYSELVVQFGYVVLFAAAFPLASAVALLNNIIEIRSDAFKMLTSIQRPHYRAAISMGTWVDILSALSVVGVLVNCAIIAFISSQLRAFTPSHSDWSDFDLLVAAVIIEHVLLGLKFLISVVIPDVPKSVVKEKEKREWLTAKLLENDVILDDETWEVEEGKDSDNFEEDSEDELKSVYDDWHLSHSRSTPTANASSQHLFA